LLAVSFDHEIEHAAGHNIAPALSRRAVAGLGLCRLFSAMTKINAGYRSRPKSSSKPSGPISGSP
jgi:hypothetical protein